MLFNKAFHTHCLKLTSLGWPYPCVNTETGEVPHFGEPMVLGPQHSISECNLVAMYHWSTQYHTFGVKIWSLPPLWRRYSDCNFISLHRDVTCLTCAGVQVAWCWPLNFMSVAREADTTGKLMKIMHQLFQSLVLPWNRDIEWPVRCHLSICDCFWLQCLKSKVYVSHPGPFWIRLNIRRNCIHSFIYIP